MGNGLRLLRVLVGVNVRVVRPAIWTRDNDLRIVRVKIGRVSRIQWTVRLSLLGELIYVQHLPREAAVDRVVVCRCAIRR